MNRVAPLLILLAACGGSEEEEAAKDRAAAQATWAVTLKVDGADVRLPLKSMNVLLFKDEEYAKANPSAFEIEGQGIHLIGEIAPADDVGYGEKWEKLLGKTLAIKASGEFHRDHVDSKITLANSEVAVTGGSMVVEKFTGKWSGSEGNKTLSGRIKLTLQDGRTLEGTFAVHAITWG
jgi:hypothetical protein